MKMKFEKDSSVKEEKDGEISVCGATSPSRPMNITNHNGKTVKSTTLDTNSKEINESRDNDSELEISNDESPNKKCKVQCEKEDTDRMGSRIGSEVDQCKGSEFDKCSSSVIDKPKEETPHENGFCDVNSLNNPKNVAELTEVCSKSDRDQSCYITSIVPDICKDQPCILGIDEAGRGPVLGPMVYGVCYCPKSKEDDLKETGCADSKSLTEEKREKIFNDICKHNEYIGWEVEVISPKVISTSMLRRSKVSLNEVSHNSAIGLLKRALEAGVMVSEVFVDTVGPAEKYEAKLKNLFPELLITVAKKADATYPIVGGASICAKVTRDVAIKSWTFSQTDSSEAWGSGYPNDPVTKKFLANTMDNIFGFPNIVRFSWSTAEKILEDSAVRVDWEDEETVKGAGSVKTFFSPTEQKQHKYFRNRCLKNTVTL